eukprot:183062_1
MTEQLSTDIDINDETEKLLEAMEPHEIMFLQSGHNQIKNNKKIYINTKKRRFEMTWSHITNCVRHEMWPKLSSILQSIVDNHEEIKKEDLKQQNIDAILRELKTKRNLEQDELKYFLNLIKRAKNFKVSQPTCQYNENINDKRLELLNDIFNVHRSFLWINYHFYEYEKSQWIETIQNAQTMSSLDFTLPTWPVIKQNDPFNFYPSYLIDDNVFSIMNYFFMISFYVNKIQELCNTSQFELHAFIIPKSTTCVYDKNTSFDHDIGDINEYLRHVNVYNYGRSVIRVRNIQDMHNFEVFLQHHYNYNDIKSDTQTK